MEAFAEDILYHKRTTISFVLKTNSSCVSGGGSGNEPLRSHFATTPSSRVLHSSTVCSAQQYTVEWYIMVATAVGDKNGSC